MAVGSGTNREPRTHLPWRGESSKCGGSGHTVVVVQPLYDSIRLPTAFWSSCYFFNEFSAAPSDPA